MAKYRVIRQFSDRFDNGYVYHRNDAFPRAGHTVSYERIAELATGNNRCNRVYIEEVKPEENTPETKKTKAVKEVKEEPVSPELINPYDAKPQEDKPKITRNVINKAKKSVLLKLAEENGFGDMSGMTAPELKKILLDYYKL